MRWRRQWVQRLLLSALAITMLGWALRQWAPQVLVYAPSPSLPKGWYIRILPGHPLQVGDLVSLWTPESLVPRMPPNVPPYRLLKRVAALAGMEVCWTAAGMQVGQEQYPRHAAIQAEPAWQGCTVLTRDEMVIVGSHPRSMDSRYIGPVPCRLVRFQVRPLWTWDGEG